MLAFNWLKSMTSSSKFCINISHLNESETLKTVMSEFFLCEVFSPGHVLITTIIKTSGDIINLQRWIWDRGVSPSHGWSGRVTPIEVGLIGSSSLSGQGCHGLEMLGEGHTWSTSIEHKLRAHFINHILISNQFDICVTFCNFHTIRTISNLFY